METFDSPPEKGPGITQTEEKLDCNRQAFIRALKEDTRTDLGRYAAHIFKRWMEIGTGEKAIARVASCQPRWTLREAREVVKAYYDITRGEGLSKSALMPMSNAETSHTPGTEPNYREAIRRITPRKTLFRLSSQRVPSAVFMEWVAKDLGVNAESVRSFLVRNVDLIPRWIEPIGFSQQEIEQQRVRAGAQLKKEFAQEEISRPLTAKERFFDDIGGELIKIPDTETISISELARRVVATRGGTLGAKVVINRIYKNQDELKKRFPSLWPRVEKWKKSSL